MLPGASTCGGLGLGRDKLPKLSNLTRSLANCHCGRQASGARFPKTDSKKRKNHEQLHICFGTKLDKYIYPADKFINTHMFSVIWLTVHRKLIFFPDQSGTMEREYLMGGNAGSTAKEIADNTFAICRLILNIIKHECKTLQACELQ